MSDADFDGWKRRAKRVRIEDELARRGVRLKTVSRRRDSWQLAGPCPVCGGDDRFSVHPGRQAWNCRHCSRGGDVIELVRVLDNCSFEVACETLTREDRPAVARRTPPVSAKDTRASHAESDAEGTRRALRLWDEGVPLEGTDAELYLQRRRLEIPDRMLASGRMLRFHGACPFGPDVRHPCMMSLFRSITTNTAQAIQRTAVGPDGIKIGRLSLGPVSGAAVKISDDDEVSTGLTIGEGLETVISGMTMGFAPAWCVGSAGAIRVFPVLPGIECLTILVDNDKNGKGPDAAAECSARWTAAGREVARIIPRVQGRDMADLVGTA